MTCEVEAMNRKLVPAFQGAVRRAALSRGSADPRPGRSSCVPRMKRTWLRICLSGMVERSSPPSEARDPGPQAWCVCGEKVTIADAREVTLPNGRPGWEGYCPGCGGPLFAARRKPADS